MSCHFVDGTIDTGDLVEVERFPIDPDQETALSLDVLSQERLLALFQRVMSRALAGEELPREPQGEGRYVSREELEELRVVHPGDDLERKLRAFWYPPWPGAVIEVDGPSADARRRGAAERAGTDLPRGRRGAVDREQGSPPKSTLRA